MSLRQPTFGTALKGYACAEVDALVDQIGLTLDGTAGGGALTPDAVRSAVFSIVLRGYREDEVDAYLDSVVAELERRAIQPAAVVPVTPVVPVAPIVPIAPVAESWTDLLRERAELLGCAQQPAGQRFERVGVLRAGYALADVDAFVDEVRGKIGSTLTPAEVSGVRFTQARRGYDEEAVDDWLGRIESLLVRTNQGQ
ncbi:DivIVA domain-containing protein [Flindersiella endophytica]